MAYVHYVYCCMHNHIICPKSGQTAWQLPKNGFSQTPVPHRIQKHCMVKGCNTNPNDPCWARGLGFDKIGPFFWHFMLLALPFFWPNYANFYALLAEKCSLMLDILNSNSVKHDLTINLITMALVCAEHGGQNSLYFKLRMHPHKHTESCPTNYRYIVMHMYRSC